jgi:hypothetical protein
MKKVQRFIFRTLTIYLALIFLLMSRYLETYNFFPYINKPFDKIIALATHAFSAIFLGRQFPVSADFNDSYWTYAALAACLLLAATLAAIWIQAFKKTDELRVYAYSQLIARYYLAAIMLGYGVSKLLGDQFGRVDFDTLISPVGSLRPRALFWGFMGASRSYQIFGGALETLAGALMLFRRTTLVACLLTFALLANIFMLDLAYDVAVKARIVYFAVLTVFIMSPDLKKLFQFFILKTGVQLSDLQWVYTGGKNAWLKRGLKFLVITVILLVIVRKHIIVYPQYHHAQNQGIAGIYKVQAFYLNGQLDGGSLSWSKIAINRYFPRFAIQTIDDSFAEYTFKADSVKGLIELYYAGKNLPVGSLRYSTSGDGSWQFEGRLKKDSIAFRSRKVNEKDILLQKGYGQMIWNF